VSSAKIAAGILERDRHFHDLRGAAARSFTLRASLSGQSPKFSHGASRVRGQGAATKAGCSTTPKRER